MEPIREVFRVRILARYVDHWRRFRDKAKCDGQAENVRTWDEVLNEDSKKLAAMTGEQFR